MSDSVRDVRDLTLSEGHALLARMPKELLADVPGEVREFFDNEASVAVHIMTREDWLRAAVEAYDRHAALALEELPW